MSGVFTNYIMPALKMLSGGASQFAAPGNVLGTSAMTSGASQLFGNALGGGPAQQFTPWNQAGAELQGTVNSALANSPPAIPGGTPSLAPYQGMVTGIGPQDGAVAAADPATGDPASSAAMSAGVGKIGQDYLNYLIGLRLERQRQRTAYAQPHTSAFTTMAPQVSLYPNETFALPRITG
jgi:hypothetical protein